MHADRGMAGARTAGHEAQARLAGQLAVGVGHVGGAGLVAGIDQADFVAAVIKRVEHRQIAFAGHAEGRVGPLLQKLVHQNAPTVAGIGLRLGHVQIDLEGMRGPEDRPEGGASITPDETRDGGRWVEPAGRCAEVWAARGAIARTAATAPGGRLSNSVPDRRTGRPNSDRHGQSRPAARPRWRPCPPATA